MNNYYNYIFLFLIIRDNKLSFHFTPQAKIASKYTPPHTRTKTMVELKYQIEKLEDIKVLVANQKSLKEEMENNNAVLKE